ncbi:MAG: hypothetical protein M1834_000707 [Cirrosporium novae-zelandiae]|nr:MAG: hypothetical protein M1834_000707 [Cirrosporium novae-zelandiae]
MVLYDPYENHFATPPAFNMPELSPTSTAESPIGSPGKDRFKGVNWEGWDGPCWASARIETRPCTVGIFEDLGANPPADVPHAPLRHRPSEADSSMPPMDARNRRRFSDNTLPLYPHPAHQATVPTSTSFSGSFTSQVVYNYPERPHQVTHWRRMSASKAREQMLFGNARVSEDVISREVDRVTENERQLFEGERTKREADY